MAGAISRQIQAMKILLDHHIKKQGVLLWTAIESEGWLKLLDIPMLTFRDVGLSIDSSDREIWRFAQRQKYILLTGDRKNEGIDSLEQTIQDENTPTSLPVVTVGVVDRLMERRYRERCVERLIDIIVEIENYLGVGRIYIP